MSIKFYNVLRTPHLKKIIADIKAVSNRCNIEFFGVGALARNIWFVDNDLHSRGTKDVDFGVYIPNINLYNQLRKILLSDYSYEEATENAFCLISPYGIPVDLLPFGEIENQGKVIVEGKGLVSINLDGFNEVFLNGLIETNIENDTLKICSIPSVVLLKLIAFDDRPEHRLSDPLDISSIINHYPSLETNLIWEEYNFLYDDEKTHDEVGTMVLGYEISKIICINNDLEERVLRILEKAVQLESNLAEKMIQNSEIETVQQKINLLKILRDGIIKGLKK